ncbi:MAG: glycine zipper domain-containing protein [Burkholderiaceae bacterium]
MENIKINSIRLAGSKGIAMLSALILACGFGLHSQAQASERAVGTLFGAGVGALAGQSFGGRDGAVVGGVIGAVVGNQIAHAESRHYRGGHHGPSIIFGPPIWSGHDRHFREERRWRRQARRERAARRSYREGYRQGRRDARRGDDHRRGGRSRWSTRY